MHRTTAQKGTAIRPILLEGIGTLLDKCVERARLTFIWARMISRPRGKWSSLYNALRLRRKLFAGPPCAAKSRVGIFAPERLQRRLKRRRRLPGMGTFSITVNAM